MASGSSRKGGARVANLLHGYIYSSSCLTSASWSQTGIAAGQLAPFGASMASNQIVRSRMKSVKSFRNITKAIKMVAASKLRGSQCKTEDSRGLCQPFTTVRGGAPEYRTSSCHGKHYLSESVLIEARSSNRIRLSVPWGRGLLPLLSSAVRHISTQPALAAKQRAGREEKSETEITTQEDPFDTLTDKIPVQPVSVAEGASYSIAILAGLAVALAAAYTIFKELIVEPKEYKVYGKALDRVQTDMQVAGRLGSPIHGYGQESQNRAARQRISNRQWVDEDGVEHVEVMFYIRGPGGGGKVFSEMFKDPEDKSWKYTYLIVDVTHPTPKRFLLESYVPEVKVNLSPA